ncbi:YcnI family copper-binding membrane protein [Saccharopolyspora sp. CA-218241]|uniref:YcnI family copper-binding membrane protein n=1 Tax=Saccharopolyspora sp. CA-218241 TaxID=3240027 RepID=UPI003D98B8C3
MSEKSLGARFAAAGAISALLAFAGAGTASAHVSAQPGEAPKGGHATLAFRVPNERPDAGTVAVRVTLPTDTPLSSVRTKPLPGWTASVEKVTLDRPVQVAGAEVTEAVRAITWTARPGTRIDPGEYQEFEASLGTMPTDTDTLVLPTAQTYDSGEVVRWDQPPAPDGSEPEHPAPTLTLVESEGGHSHGGGSHQEDGAAAAGGGSDDTARWLGGAGLVVGALGLGVGAGALLRSRRS